MTVALEYLSMKPGQNLNLHLNTKNRLLRVQFYNTLGPLRTENM